MPMPKMKKPTSFDVKLTAEAREQLADELCREVQDAFSARAAVIADGGLIDLYDWFYEQGRTDPNDRPFPGAADLTSYFITESVDALRARLMKAVFGVRPFCFAEGRGQDAAKAPMVEEFHDWQARKSGLKTELAKVVHGALIEDGYILEVSEKIETRRVDEEIDAALELNEQQAPVFADGQPKIQRDEAGDPVPAQPNQPFARISRSTVKTKRLGPQYDAISLKDFVFLPGHAKSQKQVWGYAYRFVARVPELLEKVKDGVYDKDAVDALGDSMDREDVTVPVTVNSTATQIGPAVEKELFQLALKRDFDEDGREEWYVATISLQHRQLLRLKLDTFVMQVGRPRCVPFVLFPRRNSVYGYSYAGDKLLTLAEEHTALRNMKADRSALATNAPMTVLQGAIWDPDVQPFGVGRTITVRDHGEIKQLQVADVPNSIVESEISLHQAKERVGGLADSFSGVLSAQARTLGENKLVSAGSAVRVDEVVGHLHAAIAEVMLLTNAIWRETLKAEPKGLEAPSGVMSALQTRGQALQDGRFTADMLTGDFQFEPYGSDDTANPDKQRADFNNGGMALANLAKVFPALQAILQSHEAAKWILQQWVRVYDVRDPMPVMDAFNSPPPPMLPPGMPMPPGAPGAAPGPPGAVAGPPGAPAGNPLAALLAMAGHGQPGGVNGPH